MLRRACKQARDHWLPFDLRGGQDRSPRPRVNECGFFGPRRLPSTSAPFEGSPPPIRQLCRCAMGFRPAFTLLARARRARPEVRAQVVHPRRAGGPRAARRLLQSKRPASTTVEPFEPCAPDVRSPSRRARIAGGFAWDVRVSAARFQRGQPRCHGSGAADAFASRGLLREAIARLRSFAPAQSPRTPPVARSW